MTIHTSKRQDALINYLFEVDRDCSSAELATVAMTLPDVQGDAKAIARRNTKRALRSLVKRGRVCQKGIVDRQCMWNLTDETRAIWNERITLRDEFTAKIDDLLANR